MHWTKRRMRCHLDNVKCLDEVAAGTLNQIHGRDFKVVDTSGFVNR